MHFLNEFTQTKHCIVDSKGDIGSNCFCSSSSSQKEEPVIREHILLSYILYIELQHILFNLNVQSTQTCRKH